MNYELRISGFRMTNKAVSCIWSTKQLNDILKLMDNRKKSHSVAIITIIFSFWRNACGLSKGIISNKYATIWEEMFFEI